MRALLCVALLFGFTCGMLTPVQRSWLLDRHNLARSSVLSPLPYPSITALTWDDDLAATAQTHADQCSFGHSFLKFTKLRGENLGLGPSPANLSAIFDGWLARGSTLDFWTSSCDDGEDPTASLHCDTYLNIIWAHTTQLGCGMSLCSGYEFLVCQYNPTGAWPGIKPYSTNETQPTAVMDDEEANDTLVTRRRYYVASKGSYDWGKHMLPARNQGNHGTCWAFSAAAACEGAYMATVDRRVAFSEQWLIDCTDPSEKGDDQATGPFASREGLAKYTYRKYVGYGTGCGSPKGALTKFGTNHIKPPK
jgi:hypothetical protein